MIGYSFTVSCTACGSALHHKAGGAVYPNRTKAIAHCTECGSDFLLSVSLQQLSGPALRESLQVDINRDPSAPGAPLIDALMACGRVKS
jgi:NAD-dependent SIR2 family protein deacetylase